MEIAGQIPTTGTQCANSMGRRLTFCAEMALKENLQAPFLMRLWRNGAAQSDRCLYSNTYLLYNQDKILQINGHNFNIK
jgi:hypothetical protein